MEKNFRYFVAIAYNFQFFRIYFNCKQNLILIFNKVKIKY